MSQNDASSELLRFTSNLGDAAWTGIDFIASYQRMKPPSPPADAIDGRALHSALFLESQSTQIAAVL
jgi:hypothetical protein